MKTLSICLLLVCLVFISHCKKESLPEYKLPEDYRTWEKPINEILDYPVPGHGKGFRRIFANKIAFSSRTLVDATGQSYTSFLDGSVIIKEIYNNKQDIGRVDPSLTIMVKARKNPYALDGWLYYRKDPNTSQTILVTGRMCIGCHEAANEKHPYFDKNPEGLFRDYVFTQFKKYNQDSTTNQTGKGTYSY